MYDIDYCKGMQQVAEISAKAQVDQIGFDEKNAIFIINETKIITRLLDGEFIEYKKLLPREQGLKIIVPNQLILRESCPE